VRLYSSARELEQMAGSPPAARVADAVVRFSLKEAVLKCIQPILGGRIDLRDLEVDAGAGRVRVEIPAALADRDRRVGAVRCNYSIAGERVVSSAWIQADCSAKGRNSLFAQLPATA